MLRVSSVGLTWTACLTALLWAQPGAAADPAPTNVLLRTAETPIVARLLAVEPRSKQASALVPSGEIATGPLEYMPPTDKPFKPATFEELEKELSTKDFPGFKTHRTTRYLYVYNCSDEFRKLTSTI